MSEPLPQPLGYAAPKLQRPPIWIPIILMASGLGLVFLGGCFLIGVLLTNANANAHQFLETPEIFLEFVLYIAAFASFAVASTLIILGVRRILSVPPS